MKVALVVVVLGLTAAAVTILVLDADDCVEAERLADREQAEIETIAQELDELPVWSPLREWTPPDAAVDERRAEMTQRTYESVERLAVLADQHPDCFTVEKRMEWEANYRRWQAGMDGRDE